MTLTPLAALLLYLAVVNALTYLSFRIDKRRATQGERRIPERRLLTLAAFGGSPAAFYARQTLRHKTTKQPFSAQLIGVAISQVFVLVMFAIMATG